MTQNNNDNINQVFTTVEKELGYLSERLPGEFRDTGALVSRILSPEQLITWAEKGLDLANCSRPLSLEVTTAYFQASTRVLDILPFASFLDWAQGGKTLCHLHPSMAIAYFRASPETLSSIPDDSIAIWLDIGRRLYRSIPESIELSSSFFTISPDLLRSLSLSRTERLVLFLNRLTATSYDRAIECLHSAPRVFTRLGHEEQVPFLNLSSTLARVDPEGAVKFFQNGAEVMAAIDRGQHKEYLSLITKIAQDNARGALSFFFNCSPLFYGIDNSWHSRLIKWGETILLISVAAGIAFLNSFPLLLNKMQASGIERWIREGSRILNQDQEAGIAYFRLESTDEKTLERLAARVDLEQVNRILLMYGQALVGTRVQIRSTETLGERSMGWIQHDLPTTDGTIIFVPPTAGNYDSERENFDWYKIAVTHQAGHIEFGTYDFSFEKEAKLFPDRRRPSPPDRANLADMVRFFNLFSDIKLSLDIFAVVEDFRIDHLLKQEYAGIRGIYRWIEQDSLSGRPSLQSLPLREAFIELLIQASLNGEPESVPGILRNRLQEAMQILRQVQLAGASVEDTSEATIRLYEIISAIPNYRLTEWQWDVPDSRSAEILPEEEVPEPEACENIDPESGLEVPYHAAAEVEFRGNFNPEFVQLLQTLQENPELLGMDPLTLSSEELEIGRILRGEIFTTGMYVTDLPVTTNAPATAADEPETEPVEPRVAKPAGKMQADEEGESFFYDEWDYQASSYRPRWCRVREKPVAEGNTDFFENTLVRNSLLAAQIKKQFEMLAPELLQKLNRLHDGEELDLNAVIEALVDRKAGHIPDEKVYWKRRKVKRDVAVVFLIDMSSSTADVINHDEEEEDFADWYFARFQSLLKSRAERNQRLMQSPRQVIDIAKESMVLMINALEATGDCYGIYGFSGHGRDNVEFLVIKDIDELFSPTVKRRIDRVRPLHSTRMGPAIRHASSKLESHDAKTKILFLVSDGYPQDEEYGRDNNDKEYALHDTRMALIEAKRKSIVPFCLTIDIAGYDYLKKMAQDIGYEVVNNVESLPERLPILYKKLTS